ncbi:Bzz1-Myo3 5p-Bee1p-Vrp1p actin assembly complex component [Pyrrhoderma noxium]|uniref:Bzz1-Myo3 5p-Bee1p-Vrp1p actin assembly complex component n=1 Tax=Pyrrhoderma noxium TaxID=2282107 RepID=A0A286UBZ1_9AGAM|nr:Bzz1-Myo3 5p-Bee1p-Vrp1p actin assembly complex component [Pyrrhoderma noxium]
MATPKSFGQSLPDQVDRIVALCDSQLGLLSDTREIYKDRAALEKEYATKLAALAKRASEKRNKRIASLVVGDEPSKTLDDAALRMSTFDKAYSQLVNSLEATSQDHASLSEVLISQVADATRTLEKKHEDMKSKQYQFYQKLLSDRDKIYAERIKMKQKYDEECLEIESYRKKQDRSQDDKHASRAAKQFDSQMVDMRNSKNTYIIATAIANQTKDRFYNVDLPLIEDVRHVPCTSLRLLISSFPEHATPARELDHSVQETLGQVNAASDQDLFIAYNTRMFTVPNDWGWEPCAGYYDTGEMATESEPKIFLQNKLTRCREKLEETQRQIDIKNRDTEKMFNILTTYMKNRSIGSVDDVMNDYLGVQQELTLLEFSASILIAEIETISNSLGGDEGSQSPHSFKPTSFSIPTTCGYCKSSIWGLSKQGKTCKTCGLCVHAKCELKVPANCSGGTRTSKVTTGSNSTLSRTGSQASIRPTATASSRISLIQPQPQPIPEHFPAARVLYDFIPSSAHELAVSEGMTIQIEEDDDGSGWIKVIDPQGKKGLIPASYVEVIEDNHGSRDAPKIPISTKPNIRGSGQIVRAIYDYKAGGSDELNLEQGGTYELSAGPQGGQNYADGWWEGYDSKGKKGIFPSNYVELA